MYSVIIFNFVWIYISLRVCHYKIFYYKGEDYGAFLFLIYALYFFPGLFNSNIEKDIHYLMYVFFEHRIIDLFGAVLAIIVFYIRNKRLVKNYFARPKKIKALEDIIAKIDDM